MATKNITPNSVFENQINGSVFAKEGHLNDPALGNIEGQFQSWKYSFDSGKQIFRATNSDKIYVKRLVKNPADGVPHWTQWMEYSTAEANGIQAIAVNDRALQLPNADGAIKLEITPASIGTYSREEIYDLIDEKISEDHYSIYEYVEWIEGCATAEEVLSKAYPNGGETQKFYLVVYTDNNVEKSAFYTYSASGLWVNVNVPDLSMFVTYTDFNKHNEEFTAHISDTDVHITADERAEWNSRLGALEEEDRLNQEQVSNHLTAIGDTASPHVTSEERARWNKLANEVQSFPTATNPDRYVIQAGQYVPAFEQILRDEKASNSLFMNAASLVLGSGDYLVKQDAGLIPAVNELLQHNNVVTSIAIELLYNGLRPGDKWYLETDTGLVSEEFDSTVSSAFAKFDVAQYPETIAIKGNFTRKFTLSNIKVYIQYYPKKGLALGDPSKVLALNLVGPEDSVPTYNGTPLSELTGYGQWGQITGDITEQKDLQAQIAKLLATKLSGAGDSNLRYDVFQNTLVRAICQQVQSTSIENVELKPDTEDESIEAPVATKTKLITDVQAKLTELKEAGYTVLGYNLSIEHIDTDKPVYFYTNNSAIDASPQVTAGKFEWDWPGQTQLEFNSIYVGGNSPTHLGKVKLTIKVVKYGDIQIGLPADTTHPDGYNITITADELSLASKHRMHIISDTEIHAVAQEIQITGKLDVDNAATFSDTVTIHGEEVDIRYLNKATGETEIANLKAADTALDERIKTLEASSSESPEVLTTLENRINAKIEADDAVLQSSISELNGKIGEITATAQAAEASANSAISSLDTVSSDLNALSTQHKSDIDSLDALISDVSAKVTEEVASTNQNFLDVNTHLREIDSTLEAHNTNIENLEKEVTELRDSASVLTADHLETFDLVISSDDELNRYIQDGSFEKSARILFKSGTYHYTGNKTSALNFGEIKLIKGEHPCKVYMNEDSMSAPKNFENTLFEDIYMTIGFDTTAEIFDSRANKVLEVEVTEAETEVKLNNLYSIYKLNIKADTVITLTNVQSGKDYMFLIDQGDEAHTVKFTNTFTNGTSELNTQLNHQVPGYRTVIKATALNDVAADAFILTEVIYGVINEDTRVGLVEVVIGNVKAPVHNAAYTRASVNYSTDSSLGKYYPGSSFSFAPRILDGFAHSKTRDYDYTVSVRETNEVVATGRCDTSTVIKIPSSLKALSDGSMPTLVVDFNLDPQLVTIKLAEGFDKYVESKSGFTQIQTANFERTSIDLKLKDDFYCYRITDSLGNELQGSLPWVYSLPANATREDYEITITPRFYAAFNEVDMEVVSPYSFDKTSIVLPGKNEIAFEANVSEAVKNDANYGKLYGQAPIALVAGDDGCTMITSYVDSGANTTDQEGVLTVPASLIGKDVTYKLTWPGKETPVTKTFSVANVPESSCSIKFDGGMTIEDGAVVLDTDATNHSQFDVSVDWGKTAAIINKNGTWRTSNGNATIIKQDADHAVIAAQTKGKVVLYFQSAVTGDEYKVTCLVKVHAASISVTDIHTATSTTVIPVVTYLDANGNKINAAVLSDASYTLSTSSNRITVEESALVVDNTPIADAENSVEAPFTVTTNDGHLTASANIVVRRNQYVLQFEIVDKNITGITSSTVGYKYGGTVFTLTVNYLSGASATEATINELKKKFTECTIVVNTTGLLTVSVKMPYADTTVSLA